LGTGMGMRSALELGKDRDIGASSAIDLATSASGSRPRARTFSTHSRARTISSTRSQNAAEMCRSVWEDDETQELGKGWGLVRRWLGEDPGGKFCGLLRAICSRPGVRGRRDMHQSN
jgi:hypothetical protein